MGKVTKISILGSGWLGLPLSKFLADKNYLVKTSTRSEIRAKQIRQNGFDAYVFDIENLPQSDLSFLDANILIINITSKNIPAFKDLLLELEKSKIDRVIFVSSSSVYPNLNKVVAEGDGVELKEHKLYLIENIFRQNTKFQTTVLRLSGLIGYSRHPGNWFATRPISQPNAPVNLIHRDDCIGLIEAIIDQQAWGEVFNGVADTHPIKRDYYSYAKSIQNKAPPGLVEGETLSYKIVSNAKIKDYLRYKFIHPDIMQITFDNE